MKRLLLKIECGVHGHGVKTMCATMFYTVIWPILLVVIRSSSNSEPEIDDFGIVHGGF